MEEKRDQLGQMLARSGKAVPQNVPLTSRVKVAGETTIEWADYLKLEQHMLAAFKPQQPAQSVLSMAEQVAMAAMTGKLDQLVDKGFQAFAPTEYAGQLLEVFSVNCISIMELEEAPEKRVEFMSELMTEAGVVSPRYGCRLPAFSAQPKARPSDLSLIHYYFQNLVFGKRLTGASLLDGLLTLAVGMALLVYYLEVFRADHPEQTAKEMAFELIEGDIVTHSRGLNVLLDEFPNALVAYLAEMTMAA